MAVFAGGCFWCTEAIFQRLKGVNSTVAGYVDGIESLQINFDPSVISYADLLEVFFATHDPTSRDRQGADVGQQYRSVVFYTDAKQKEIAQRQKDQIAGAVTEINPLTKFVKADAHHQNYYNQNQDAPYCQLVINPKLKELQAKFPSYL